MKPVQPPRSQQSQRIIADSHDTLPSLGLALEMFMVSALFLTLAPLLVPIGQSVGAAPSSVAIVLSVYSLCFGLSTVIAAVISDRFSTRFLLFFGASLHACAFTGLALSASISALLISAGFAGVAAGLLQPTVYRIALESAPIAKRPAWIGRLSLGWSIALTLGVPSALFVTDIVSWRVALIAFVLLWIPVLALVNPILGSSTAAPRIIQPFVGLRSRIPIYMSTLLIGLAFYAMYFFFAAAYQKAADDSASLNLSLSCFGAGCILGSILAPISLHRLGLTSTFRLCSLSIAVTLITLPVLIGLGIAFIGTLLWGIAQIVALSSLTVALAHRDAENLGAAMAVSALSMMTGASLAGITGGIVFDLYGYSAVAAASAGAAFVAGLTSAFWFRHRTAQPKARTCP